LLEVEGIEKEIGVLEFTVFGCVLLVWVGFVATVSAGMVLWGGKPVQLYLLNNVSYLIGLILMSIVLTMM
jgi:hypothetical protein